MTLWSGRFSGKLDGQAWLLNSSLPFDLRLAPQDVRASVAWAGVLYQAGVLTSTEHEQIVTGLNTIASELQGGSFAFQPSDEDIHTAVERRLGELVGAAGGKLHTGRSRNDQVATDFRLWVLEMLPRLDSAIQALQQALVNAAERSQESILPGYTHLQRAQPVTLAHWFMSFFWPLQRDRERLTGLRARTAVLPLGSGALAGTAYLIDREQLAAALGFDSPAQNSIDAVSDRDFAAEFLFCAAMVGLHLSRLAEAVVLFTSTEFGFFELSDTYATGSSLMPQKKNPDVFELARGKSGTLVGLLAGMLAVLKGLPSSYDKDLQEDKLPVFQAVDILQAVLPVLAGAVQTLTVRPAKMLAAVDAGMLATDLADYLVRKGVPFRQAHAAVAGAVRQAAELDVSLDQFSLDDWKAAGPFEEDVFDVFDPLRSVSRRCSTGGTAPEAVARQIQQAKKYFHGE